MFYYNYTLKIKNVKVFMCKVGGNRLLEIASSCLTAPLAMTSPLCHCEGHGSAPWQSLVVDLQLDGISNRTEKEIASSCLMALLAMTEVFAVIGRAHRAVTIPHSFVIARKDEVLPKQSLFFSTSGISNQL